LLDEAKKTCLKLSTTELNQLQIGNYKYEAKDAIEELGITSDLVHQLVEDYVVQIIKSEVHFLNIINELKKDEQNQKELDYTELRELIHKNLGVARNLRIKDAQTILEEMMGKEDLIYLSYAVNALYACAVKLKPTCAYDTIKLIEIKNSL